MRAEPDRAVAFPLEIERAAASSISGGRGGPSGRPGAAPSSAASAQGRAARRRTPARPLGPGARGIDEHPMPTGTPSARSIDQRPPDLAARTSRGIGRHRAARPAKSREVGSVKGRDVDIGASRLEQGAAPPRSSPGPSPPARRARLCRATTPAGSFRPVRSDKCRSPRVRRKPRSEKSAGGVRGIAGCQGQPGDLRRRHSFPARMPPSGRSHGGRKGPRLR